MRWRCGLLSGRSVAGCRCCTLSGRSERGRGQSGWLRLRGEEASPRRVPGGVRCRDHWPQAAGTNGWARRGGEASSGRARLPPRLPLPPAHLRSLPAPAQFLLSTVLGGSAAGLESLPTQWTNYIVPFTSKSSRKAKQAAREAEQEAMEMAG